MWPREPFLFVCFPNEKNSLNETFFQCGRGETKTAEAKSHQNQPVQKLFLAVEILSQGLPVKMVVQADMAHLFPQSHQNHN